MVLDVSNDDCLVNEESDAPEDVIDDGSQPNKKKRGRVPRRVLKSEREKLKREQLNELFTKLGSLLELSDPNNGKASILNETIRLLKDMITQIQSLRKENDTLLSESHYVTVEKNELKDENSALEIQIKSMQRELEEKLTQYKPDLNVTLPECWQPETGHLSQQPPMLGPLYVVPINPDFDAFQKADTATNPPVPVSKPNPRYPTAADSWPLQLLSKQPKATAESTIS
ncbi:hypothetical protein RND81_02G031100 [Saponaria officinalis]|uniref:BHLH domain-containing protein n=1 Tax=Saponaria officinalis TaxID=3572 RepID=A0AAW1MJB9_SAPOF